DPLAGPALVGGEDVRHARQVAEHLLEVVPAPRAGVRLVAPDHPRPLLARHRRGAAVGQQVDDHVLSGDLEQIEPGAAEDGLSRLGRRELDRLDHLDLERLDDRLHDELGYDPKKPAPAPKGPKMTAQGDALGRQRPGETPMASRFAWTPSRDYIEQRNVWQ